MNSFTAPTQSSEFFKRRGKIENVAALIVISTISSENSGRHLWKEKTCCPTSSFPSLKTTVSKQISLLITLMAKKWFVAVWYKTLNLKVTQLNGKQVHTILFQILKVPTCEMVQDFCNANAFYRPVLYKNFHWVKWHVTKNNCRYFLGGPEVRTSPFQCRGFGFHPWSGS